MKKLFILCLLSTHVHASNLIYKSGYEATALVSGTVSGLKNSGLVIQLAFNGAVEDLNITNNGVFVFESDIAFGENWSISILSLPSNPQQQNCLIINNNGTMPPEGAQSLRITCDNSQWNWDVMMWDEGGWN